MASSQSLDPAGGNSVPGKGWGAHLFEDGGQRWQYEKLFGELDDGDDPMELCRPMLDVVLGLFGDVDYDDAMC